MEKSLWTKEKRLLSLKRTIFKLNQDNTKLKNSLSNQSEILEKLETKAKEIWISLKLKNFNPVNIPTLLAKQ